MGLTKKAQEEVKKEVGEFLVEQTLLKVAEAKSPVSGESFRSLSADYRKFKESEGGSSQADLQLTGDLLDALSYKKTEDGIEIGFFGDQAWKADGHLKFSGKKNNLPKRRFLPGEGQSYNKDIREEVDKIIADKLAETVKINKSELKNISTKGQLYNLLSEKLGISGRASIRGAVLRTSLFDLIQDMDLTELL